MPTFFLRFVITSYWVSITLLVAGSVEADSPPRRIVENSVGMKFVAAPAGAYLLGSPESEPGRGKDEKQHRVQIDRSFHIGVFEVTQSQYEQVMHAKPSAFAAEGSFRASIKEQDTSHYPVESVSWGDAVAFCTALSNLPAERQANRTYRLPTEAEWEIAARAGGSSPWCFGKDVRQLKRFALYDLSIPAGPQAVGKLQPNAWGLYDMHGNVWEWCSDKYHSPEHAAATEPTHSAARVDWLRAIRGGGYASRSFHCRSAAREHDPQQVRDADLGFRVVMEVNASP